MDSKITEILEAFRHFKGIYEEDAVDAAITLKDEITPHLIAVLQNLLVDPKGYTEDPDNYSHTYAVMLLGHFSEARAHERLVDVFSLPGTLCYDLFGDLITEDFPMILLRTCDGSLEHIKALALNRNADDYCRGSALRAMAYATVDNTATREDVLAFYGTLFTGQEADEGSDLWSLLACRVNELYPEELMDTITRAFEDGLIGSFMINQRSFEHTLSRDKEAHLEELKEDFKRNSLDDLHASMSRWACFDPEPDDLPPTDLPVLDLPKELSSKTKRRKEARKKKRKKMSKTSKRKNRR